jgi:hypothetical protein
MTSTSLSKLATIIRQGEYTQEEIQKAGATSKKVAKLALLIESERFTTTELLYASKYDALKLQIEDRLNGAMQGWQNADRIFSSVCKDEVVSASPLHVERLSRRENIALAAKQVTDWLFRYGLIDLNNLIAAGPYWPTQPETGKEIIKDLEGDRSDE